jgi:hypothetical protein
MHLGRSQPQTFLRSLCQFTTSQSSPPLLRQHTYQEPKDSDLGKGLYSSETDRKKAPAEKQSRQPSRRPHVAFHDPVRGHLKHGVRDREQGDSYGVLEVAHVGLLHQGIACFGVQKFRIPDVSAIKII